MNSQQKEQSVLKEEQPERSVENGSTVIAPVVNQDSNLEELIKATEEANPHQKDMDPILNEVEVQLAKQQSSKV